jgi:23S rRNA (cytidine1920-2'-O)/16S rRNA (cytidine1409-2'-O)-methyltransferase
MKSRLDEEMMRRGMVQSRSQAQRLIKLGRIKANKNIVKKPHQATGPDDQIEIINQEKYVSRSGFKLSSVVPKFGLNFKDKVVLDVGSSTGGFTDYSLQNGAKKVVAVDVGSSQLHPSLRSDERIDIHEQTDIRDFKSTEDFNIIVIDVSFISLREVLPSVAKLATKKTEIVAMVKPQFEVGDRLKNKGVIKNDTIRRKILKDFEDWAKKSFVIIDKADSEVSGTKGNTERFYKLCLLADPPHQPNG